MLNEGKRILIVDSDIDSLTGMYLALLQNDYTVEAATNADEMKLRAERFCPQLLVLRAGMLGTQSALAQLLTAGKELPIVLLAEHSPVTTKGQCNYNYDILLKPFSSEELIQKVQSILCANA